MSINHLKGGIEIWIQLFCYIFPWNCFLQIFWWYVTFKFWRFLIFARELTQNAKNFPTASPRIFSKKRGYILLTWVFYKARKGMQTFSESTMHKFASCPTRNKSVFWNCPYTYSSVRWFILQMIPNDSNPILFFYKFQNFKILQTTMLKNTHNKLIFCR